MPTAAGCCGATNIPENLSASIVSACAAINGQSPTLTYNGGTDRWESPELCEGWKLVAYCSGGAFVAYIINAAEDKYVGFTSTIGLTCEPFSLVANLPFDLAGEDYPCACEFEEIADTVITISGPPPGEAVGLDVFGVGRCCCCPCLMISRTFTEEEDTDELGADFEEVSGAWEISDGTLTATGSALLLTRRFCATNYIVDLPWNADEDGDWRLIVDYLDADNYHFVAVRNPAGAEAGLRVQLWKRQGGTETALTAAWQSTGGKLTVTFGYGWFMANDTAMLPLFATVTPFHGRRVGIALSSGVQWTATSFLCNRLNQASDINEEIGCFNPFACGTTAVLPYDLQHVGPLRLQIELPGLTDDCCPLLEGTYITTFFGSHTAVSGIGGYCTWAFRSKVYCAAEDEDVIITLLLQIKPEGANFVVILAAQIASTFGFDFSSFAPSNAGSMSGVKVWKKTYGTFPDVAAFNAEALPVDSGVCVGGDDALITAL